MEMKRTKVKILCSEKLFYEILLKEWYSRIPKGNQNVQVKGALKNLQVYPLPIQGYYGLKQIKGIGEHIATYLDAAWKNLLQNYFDGVRPSVAQIKGLSPKVAFQYMENSLVSKGRGGAIPFLPRSINNNAMPSSSNKISASQPSTTKNSKNPQQSTTIDDDEDLDSFFVDSSKQNLNNISFSQPAISTFQNFSENFEVGKASQTSASNILISGSIASIRSLSPPISNSSSSVQERFNASPTKSQQTITRSPLKIQKCSAIPIEDEALSYDPSIDGDRCQLLLVVDGREKGAKRRKDVVENLVKLKVPFQLRSLSVGDYLWVLKMNNPGRGGETDEMVLDYVVERKTWDDLKASIHKTRYVEQKKRLKESGIPNVVMVVEGSPTMDTSLEQALVSTNVQNRFLVHRTMNVVGTAKFLQSISNRFMERLKTEHFCGPSFASLQEKSRKTKTMTVRDCWLRQLTICPQMSVEKAALVSARFPTIRSMVEFYRSHRNNNDSSVDISFLLQKEIPEIPKGLSTQISLFFQNV